MPPSRARVHLSLLFVQVTFGSWHVFGKYVLGHIDPFALAGMRVFGAVPLFFGIAQVLDRRRARSDRARVRIAPALGDLPQLALLGLLGVAANQLLFIVGLEHTTATNAGILMPSIPVFTAVFAALFSVERMPLPKLIGVVLAVGGALSMLDPTRFRADDGALFGNLLILSNCLCYALFVVLQERVLVRLPALTVIAWAYLFGGIVVALVTTPTLLGGSYGAVPPLAWWTVLYIVVVPTTLNYALVSWAIKHSSPALVATYTTLQPVTAALLASLFLEESVTEREVLGFLLIVAGLFLVSRAPRPGASGESSGHAPSGGR